MLSLATGFGGGIGSTGNTCCAFIGGSMGISVIHGRKDPYELPTPEERRDQLGGDNGRYRLYNNFVFTLRGKTGSTSCAKLTCPYDYYSDERKLFCRNIIGKRPPLLWSGFLPASKKAMPIPLITTSWEKVGSSQTRCFLNHNFLDIQEISMLSRTHKWRRSYV